MDTSYYISRKTSELCRGKGKYSGLEYIVIDVDGTMTDGGVYYDENGNELKKFNTRDAAGFFSAKVCGIKIVILTGRECAATSRRMKEMQADYIAQDVKDKVSFLKKFMTENGLTKEQIGYIGDDLNDYEPMKMAGFIGCPKDACEEILSIADYVSPRKGGDGVVRDVICYILRERGQWENAINLVYDIGI